MALEVCPPQSHPYNFRRDLPQEDLDDDPTSLLPASLLKLLSPATGLVSGRYTPYQTLYLLEKAKHQYLLSSRAGLLTQLAAFEAEETRCREEKEEMLDRLLRGMFGAEAARSGRQIQGIAEVLGMIQRDGISI
jgi:hypothetical protein